MIKLITANIIRSMSRPLFDDPHLLEDCLSAITHHLKGLTDLLSSQLTQVQEISGQPNDDMSIIQEQTEREGEEDDVERIKADFNSRVRILVRAQRQVEELASGYKRELKDLAKQVMKLEDKVQTLSKEKGELKEELRSSRRNKNEEELKIRKPPVPLGPTSCANCLAEGKQKNNWKALAVKIEDFKKKIAVYEIDLKSKDEEIAKLKEKFETAQKEKGTKDEQERKKLKKDNTTLRGEKVLLTTQLTAAKKQLQEKTQITDVQEIEIKKLRLQLQNLGSSLNWHTTNLQQLRNSTSRQDSQQQAQNQAALNQLTRSNTELKSLNASLLAAIEHQEEVLKQLNEKTKKLQELISKQGQKQQKRMGELQRILEDKNETIIKLKSGKPQEKSGYYADLIKVLNRKLSERQERIRDLQEKIGSHQ